jgi:hypothetical protein
VAGIGDSMLFPRSKMAAAAQLGQSRFRSNEVISVQQSGGAPPPITPTTLNPADKDTHITLSNGNLTAVGTAGWTGLVRSVSPQSAGKFYWETTFNATQSQSGVGLAIGSLAVATQTFSNAGTGKSGLIQLGNVFVDGSATLTVGGVPASNVSFGTVPSGAVICVAVDLTAQLIWWRLGAGGNWNNSAGRDPVAGTGGVSIPNVGTAYPTDCFGGADTLISNFGASAFVGAVPSGFTAGWPAGAAPIFPSGVTGVIGWWDASIAASLTLSGSDILAIADQSGGGNNLSWIGLAKPQYNATGFNSKPAFVFGGTAVANAFTNAAFPMGTGNALTIWYAGNFNSASGGANCGIISYTGQGQVSDANNAASFVLYANSAAAIAIVRNSVTLFVNCTGNANHRVILTIDPTGVMTPYVDGVSQAPSTSAGSWSTPGTVNIGRSKGLSYWAGPMGEAGIATGYSNAATVAQLDAYLKSKWGL